MRLLLTLIVCLHLLLPLAAQAQSVIKTPLSYSLQEYGVVLATAVLGGLASWYMKVRKGELQVWNLAALIGELCVSAFAGLLAFWLCEYFNLNPLLTPAIVGMAGHAGAKGIVWLEAIGQKVLEKRLGIDPVKETP
ncbi:MAG: phage holin family protein [Polaromonas sp.]